MRIRLWSTLIIRMLKHSLVHQTSLKWALILQMINHCPLIPSTTKITTPVNLSTLAAQSKHRTSHWRTNPISNNKLRTTIKLTNPSIHSTQVANNNNTSQLSSGLWKKIIFWRINRQMIGHCLNWTINQITLRISSRFKNHLLFLELVIMSNL